MRARGGQRSDYQPWRGFASALTLVEHWRRRYEIAGLYFADLDALGAKEGVPQWPYLRRLVRHFPQLSVWADVAIRDRKRLQMCRDCGAYPVIGSETLHSLSQWQDLQSHDPGAILSLDQKNGVFLGPVILENDPTWWPEKVIVMSLSRVGMQQGPDLARLRRLIALPNAQRHKLYAAGGLRHGDDLRALRQLGIAGVLTASLLHAQIPL